MKREVVVLADVAALAEEAARRLAAAAREGVAITGSFAVALSGGKTPLAAYSRLAEADLLSREKLHRCHWFWGDERCVPPSHPDSNFGAAWQAGLKRLVEGDLSRVHRIPCEKAPREAAAAYETLLRDFFKPPPGTTPRFDLVLLGLGADGHTASLFPGTEAVKEQRRWVVPVWVPEQGAWRVSLTLPVINAARQVMFLVVGESKAEVVRACLAVEPGEGELPAQRVAPRDGELVWLLDQAAASLLGPQSQEGENGERKKA